MRPLKNIHSRSRFTQSRLKLEEELSPDGISKKDKSYLSFQGELFRKTIHLCALSIPIIYFLFNPNIVISLLFAAFVISSGFDLVRLYGNYAIRKYLGVAVGFMIRPRERKSFSGSTTIVFAGLLVYLFYDLPVAAAAMVIIIVGDPAAAVIGRIVGKIRFSNKKSLEGTLAFIMFSLLGMLLIPGLDFQLGLIGVLVGALIEILPIPVDDNISVPILAGGAMQFMLAYQMFP